MGSVFVCELVCVIIHASRLTPKGCVLGGWACHGKINDFLSDFSREVKHGGLPLAPCCLLHVRHSTQRPHRATRACFDLLCFLRPSASQSPRRRPVESHICMRAMLLISVSVLVDAGLPISVQISGGGWMSLVICASINSSVSQSLDIYNQNYRKACFHGQRCFLHFG